MAKKQFNVIDFGAIGDTELPQTKAIQAALDACFLAGGGEVVIPAGVSLVTGDIRIRSNTTLHLMENAELLGSENIEDYQNINNDKLEPLPKEQNTRLRWVSSREWQINGKGFKSHLYTAGSYWNYGIIRAVYAENIAIIGESGARIDGRNLFDAKGENNYRGPHAINMHFCKNLRFSGYTVENAGNWGYAIFQSENIVFENLTVLAGHDALHTRACSNVKIENCRLMTGDDAIAGFNNVGVEIKKCEISSACSAFRYGGYDILVEDCEIKGPCPYQFRGSFSDEEKRNSASTSKHARRNTLSFWTNFVSDDLPEIKRAGKILIRNCRVENADRFLHLNLSGNEAWQRGAPPTDISFENIEASGIERGLVLYGAEKFPIEITLRNINYTRRDGEKKYPFLRVAYCDKISLEGLTLNGFGNETLIEAWSDVAEIDARAFEAADDLKLVERVEKPFECEPI